MENNATLDKKLIEFLKEIDVDIDNGVHNDLNDILKTSSLLRDIIENEGYSCNCILRRIGSIIKNLDGDVIKKLSSVDMYRREIYTIWFTHIDEPSLEFEPHKSYGFIKGINKIVGCEDTKDLIRKLVRKLEEQVETIGIDNNTTKGV